MTCTTHLFYFCPGYCIKLQMIVPNLMSIPLELRESSSAACGSWDSREQILCPEWESFFTQGKGSRECLLVAKTFLFIWGAHLRIHNYWTYIFFHFSVTNMKQSKACAFQGLVEQEWSLSTLTAPLLCGRNCWEFGSILLKKSHPQPHQLWEISIYAYILHP